MGHAIGNSHAPEAAPGDEYPAVSREAPLDRLDASQVADDVLGAGAGPAVDARQNRSAGDAEQAIQIGADRGDDRLVRQLDDVRVVRAADERPKEDGPLRRATLPLC